ncbi:acetylornithine transaminase [Fictibacillus sp. Mic-4]|uniref:acetylornithine transaminase n=1 Tax=Fictibacillus sp. Mic-4 TaxID=3132826 RepID=UPI003CF95EB7
MSTLFPTYKRWELDITSGSGTFLYDKAGNEYLDFACGIAVCNLGHCHPAVVKKLKEQAETLWHISNLFTIEKQEVVAKKLTSHSPCDLVFFCNSGAEANEAAIKLARKYTGKTKIITFKQSFHGRTFASMSATGQDKIKAGFGEMLPTFVHVPFNDFNAFRQEVDENTAAVLIEVIQGEGGVIPANHEFLGQIEQYCNENHILFMIDEVQTGIGRTGKRFAFEHYHLSPDIVTLAKGLGNGFPVGALMGKGYLKDAFGPGSHGTTFGGNPLAMAVADAVLTEIFQDDFLRDVSEKGNYLLSLLNEKVKEIESVEEIRGKGLMIGIELKDNAEKIVTALRKEGLIVVPAGEKVIRLLPPLTVSQEEIRQAVKLIEKVLKDQLLAIDV